MLIFLIFCAKLFAVTSKPGAEKEKETKKEDIWKNGVCIRQLEKRGN